ncbi:caspase family protein [Rhizobium laguerreae]|uniref:caspase family protein n=1 Tax=Rhizobium laguerreae TaxID=1076926 RepID=UPI001C912119|nr:caspase family protein [Rhizobium laguerreae]MBY3323015.1 caspase family protein [Rhizobium laguerreae]MBY3392079.1 caspase family protein [Rhizobium laguerreae]
MRRALVVGIDHYQHISRLFGCVNDATSVASRLERNEDRSRNFDVRTALGSDAKDLLTRDELREAVEELFKGDGEVALFYFAGHGHIEATGGYLCPGDCKSGHDGLALSDIMTFANNSGFRNKIIVLDSCHSGIAGNHPAYGAMAELKDGVTILTASTADQYASEKNGSGVFTTLFVDALDGGAANLVGDVTPGSVYAHIDQSLWAWAQRPVFKTNVQSFISLRKVRPPIVLADLQRIAEFFPSTDFHFPLDPSYEPERPAPVPGVAAPDPEKNKVFAILQKFNRLNLLVPEDAPHMYHAAMDSKTVRLTALGEHYRRLVAEGLI